MVQKSWQAISGVGFKVLFSYLVECSSTWKTPSLGVHRHFPQGPAVGCINLGTTGEVLRGQEHLPELSALSAGAQHLSAPQKVYLLPSATGLPGKRIKNRGKFPCPEESHWDIREHPIHKTAASVLPNWCVWLTLCSVLTIILYLESRQLALL